MATDENTYGFSKADAADLLNSIGNVEVPLMSRFPRGDLTIQLGQTGTAGLTSTAAGVVTLYSESTAGWTLTTNTVSCWTFPGTIVGSVDVMVFEVGSRNVALEVCA